MARTAALLAVSASLLASCTLTMAGFPSMTGVGPNGEYFLGPQGWTCAEACAQVGRVCNPAIQTDNSSALFTDLGVKCTPDARPWWANDQPCFVADPKDPNANRCLGFSDMPATVPCDGSYPAVERLCRCTADATVGAFGTGLSGASINVEETQIFSHVAPEGHYGVMTHFWATAPHGVLDDAIIRYYVDDETTASVQFAPPMAGGTYPGEESAPWGTKWFGKGAADGAWFNNFRIPFQKNIRVTAQHPKGSGAFYMIVRGAHDLPISIGDFPLPSTAKLLTFNLDTNLQPMEFISLANVSTGSGLFFMSTLAVDSPNLNFLEGCFHLYSPFDTAFPGTLLSTGTEDYYDSAWYFNAGQFHMPVSGFTHLNKTGGISWSAYRFHEMDPLPFSDGLRFEWRNGDMLDPSSGHKCFTQTGGHIVGSPGVSHLRSLAWVYTF